MTSMTLRLHLKLPKKNSRENLQGKRLAVHSMTTEALPVCAVTSTSLPSKTAGMLCLQVFVGVKKKSSEGRMTIGWIFSKPLNLRVIFWGGVQFPLLFTTVWWNSGKMTIFWDFSKPEFHWRIFWRMDFSLLCNPLLNWEDFLLKGSFSLGNSVPLLFTTIWGQLVNPAVKGRPFKKVAPDFFSA